MAPAPEKVATNIDDVQTFLECCAIVERDDFPAPKTYLQLAECLGAKYTTMLGQLQRVVDYFFGPEYKPSGRSSGLELLFEPDKKGGPLALTYPAEKLREGLRTLHDLYTDCQSVARRAAQECNRGKPSLPVVRLGFPHTIGHFLTSHVFSGWHKYFGDRLTLEVELGNTTNLLKRLGVALLDAVIGFGTEKAVFLDDRLALEFRSFKKSSGMVLASPCAGRAWEAATAAAARFYRAPLENQTSLSAKWATGALADLTPVRLRDFDPKLVPLIVVPSYAQLSALDRAARAWAKAATLIRVESYSDAITLVRSGMGVGAVTENFTQESGVICFRLEPAAAFRRWLGYYRRAGVQLAPEAGDLIDFMRAYLSEFADDLFQKKPPPNVSQPAYQRVWSRLSTKS